jgi:PDZ domain-containing secreted protein
MTEEYVIEKDVPIVGVYNRDSGALIQAADKMEIGDSINLGDYTKCGSKVQQLQLMLQKRYGPDAKVTSRRQADNTIQVWRTK